MSKRANPVMIGSFVVGTVVLIVLFFVFAGGGQFSSYDQVRYELVYKSSIKGLSIGAPVTLRGVKIGEVSTIKVRYFADRHDVLHSIHVDIYPDVVVQEDGMYKENLPERLIQEGFGAQLKPQSLLTGLLYIELDIYDEKASSVAIKTDYPQIPTVPSNLESLSKGLDEMDIPALVADLKEVVNNMKILTSSDESGSVASILSHALGSFDAMSVEINNSFSAMSKEFLPIAKDIRSLSDNLSQHLPETISLLNKMMEEMKRSLVTMQGTALQMKDALDPQSKMFYQLQQSSKDISKAARAVDALAEMLEQQPNAIWSGRKELVQ